MYLKYLDEEPVLQTSLVLSRIFLVVQRAEGDKSAFRTHAVAFAAHEHKDVSRNAILLLSQIGTAPDAPVVASQLKRKTNDVAYFDSILTTLSAIGTEAEVGVLEMQRAAGLLKDHPRFWDRVGECETAIRVRIDKKA